MQTFATIARSIIRYALAPAFAGGAVLAASCAHAAKVDGGDDGGGTSLVGPGGGSGGTTPPISLMQCTQASPCTDFPSSPILDTPLPGNPQVPSNAAQIFGSPGSGSMSGGPCIHEPQDNTLFPRNWLRPRVLFTAAGSQNLFEIRMHTDGEKDDLVVYTTNTSWALENSKDAAGQTLWDRLRSKVILAPISITVRGVNSSGGTPTVSSQVTFKIAPAEANGALIYWTTASFDNSATNTTLQGFQTGDEGTTTALTSSQVVQQVRAVPLDGGNLTPNFQGVYCIGCHTATPDGLYVGFTSQWPWANALATVAADAAVGTPPPWLTAGAVQNLSPDMKDMNSSYYAPPAVNQIMLGIQTFSKGHYSSGDHVVISQIGASLNSAGLNAVTAPTGVTSQLAWFDLEWNGAAGSLVSGLPMVPCTGNPTIPAGVQSQPCATPQAPNGGWGILQRGGDMNNSAAAPNWSHDGNTIAYASTVSATKDGRVDMGPSDVKLVPYGNKAGGQATPVQGASDAAFNEYYPAFSPDDKLLAFNRVASQYSMYNQPHAEVFVVPASGGSATRLNANDPPACSGLMSPDPGVQNTWPKWAPNVETDPKDGKQYYWVTFSSTRHPKAGGKQQLYVAGVVYNPDTRRFDTYSAIYLWNQSYLVNNLIPSWQNLQIAHGTTPPPK